MRYEPVLRILKNVGADRAYFLCGVNKSKVKLCTLLCNPIINELEILIIILWKEIVCLFEKELNEVIGQNTNKVPHTITKDPLTDLLSIHILNSCNPLREKNNDYFSITQ